MKASGSLRTAEVAVVGVGICGLGLDGSRAFIERLVKNQTAGEAPGGRDLCLVALGAAAEAYGGAGTWNQARSSLFLSLERNPGGGLERLPRVLEQRFGMQGKGGICFGDDLGGNLALEAAIRRIETGLLDGALVGAVQAWPGRDGSTLGGLAVFLALRRRDAAQRSRDRIWTVLAPGPVRRRRPLRFDPREFLGDQGTAVSGLLQVAAGCVMAAHHACCSQEDHRWQPLLDRTDGVGFALEVETPRGGKTGSDFWRPFQPGPAPLPLFQAPGLAIYGGDTLQDLLRRVILDERGGAGPVRLAVLAQGARERREVLERVPQALKRCGGAPGWVDPRACFSPAPVRGKVACLFTPAGAGYLGMGRELLLGMPYLPMFMRGYRDLTAAGWVYGAQPGPPGDLLGDWTATMFLSQVHAAYTRDVLGIRPDLALGVSQGEMNALTAYGAWECREGEFERLRADRAYTRLLAGAGEAARSWWGLPAETPAQWRTWTVFGPVAKVQERAAQEERAYVSMVLSPVHCMLSGDAEACRRVMAGCPDLTAFLTAGSTLHTPILGAQRQVWQRHHLRPTRPVQGIEFHSAHFRGAYDLSDDRTAMAITGQAMMPVDFPEMAWRAWDAGVRIFIEHGPRSLLTSALMRILPRREGVFLAMDVQGENALLKAVKVAAELWCRGVAVDLARLVAALDSCPAAPPPVDLHLEVAASLFAASLARTGSLDRAYQACLLDTQGRILEFMGLPRKD